MKKIQTANHKRTTIGNGKRTVGLASQSRVARKKTVSRTTISASKVSTRRPAAAKTGGCSGCSRNKK